MRLRELAFAACTCIPISTACGSAQEAGVPACEPDNAGLTLPDGFCAIVVADTVGRARHLAVAANGDVIVALARQRGRDGSPPIDGGVLVLRDTTGDGVADLRRKFGSGSGDDVELRDGYLFYSTNEGVVRYPWQVGGMEPTGPADTIIKDLPATRSHRTKNFAFGPDGALYVNMGSPSNACQQQDRAAGSPGKDPCDELETRAGIWRFDPDRIGQTQADATQLVCGTRLP